MNDFLLGVLGGAALTLLVLLRAGLIGDNEPIIVRTTKPIEPLGMYIKVNPAGVNDTTYVYEVKSD